MAEKRENSVLFSLRELRQIEDDRIKQEDDEARARAEAERQAREEAARRAREEEERRIREAQDAERRAREEQERRVREDQLRLEEAERRARIEAQTRLEEQRIKMVVEAEAIHGSKKKPVVLIVSMVVLLLGASGLGVYMYMDAQDAKARQAALEAENAELQRNIDEALRIQTQKEQEYAALLDQYQKAASEQDRQRILAELEAKKREQDAARQNLQNLRERQNTKGGAKPKPSAKPAGPACAKDDPLCGAK